MTKIQTTDSRTANLTFEDISNGSMFTDKDFDRPYIKMPIFTYYQQNHFSSTDRCIALPNLL